MKQEKVTKKQNDKETVCSSLTSLPDKHRYSVYAKKKKKKKIGMFDQSQNLKPDL